MEVKIDNIIANTKIAKELNIEEIAEKISEFSYDPDQFKGLTFKLTEPKTAVLILPDGTLICTGAKKNSEIEESFRIIANMMKKAGIKIKAKPKIEIQNVIASTDVKQELHLSSISQALIMENVNYQPEQFPGLIYNMDETGALILIFSSGKIVCNGLKNEKDAKEAIEKIKEKLCSIGAL